MTISKGETLGLVTGVLLLAGALVSGCGSDPEPAPTGQNRGNEVNRADPRATADAFATMYAAGNVPGACQLVTDELRDRLGSKCAGQQAWNTTAAFTKTCETAKGTYFKYESTVGSLDRFDGLEVWVSAAGDGLWTVSESGTYSRDQQHDVCGAAASGYDVTTAPAPTRTESG